MSDLDHLAAIHAASFTTPRPWDAREMAEILAVPGTYLLEEAGAFVIGRVILDEVELLTIAVAPSARRQGLGARLLEGFHAAALRRGAVTAFLEVAEDNQPAQRLYEAAGWQRVGRRKAYYRTENGQAVDAVVMNKALIVPDSLAV